MASSHERSSASPAPQKRRREQEDDEIPIATKKKKSKHPNPSRKRAGGTFAEDLDVEKGLNNAIGKMDSQLLTDFLAQQTTRHCGDLSTVELQDLYLPGMYDCHKGFYGNGSVASFLFDQCCASQSC